MAEEKDTLIMKADGVLRNISKWVSYVGMAMVIIMMLMVVVDVILRFVFNTPILGSVEVASYLLSIIAFTSIPLVESEEMHIVIPLIFDRFPKKVRLVLNFLISLIGLCVLVLISVASYYLAIEYLHRGKVTQVLSIPLYPFVIISTICISLYAIILVVNSIKYFHLNR
ncbi:MAG: TRAP transporter small permease [Desulfobacteraceae bacterium]|jgi:TRAP-type C4-dicarboxylate transport system permease small subunit